MCPAAARFGAAHQHRCSADTGGVSPRGCAGASPGLLAELAGLARAGSPAALNRLLHGIEAPVYRYLLTRLRAAPDAGDLALDLRQETLIRAAASLARCTFASDARVVAWALTIARNVLLDHLRAARGRGEVRDDAGRAYAGAEWPPPDDGSPPRLLETFAAEALAEVPEDTAELLRLRLVAGRSWKEVGEALGVAESAAKRRFQRVQAALRRRILARVDALPPDARRAATLRLLPAAAPPPDGAAFRSHGSKPTPAGRTGGPSRTLRLPETPE